MVLEHFRRFRHFEIWCKNYGKSTTKFPLAVEDVIVRIIFKFEIAGTVNFDEQKWFFNGTLGTALIDGER